MLKPKQEVPLVLAIIVEHNAGPSRLLALRDILFCACDPFTTNMMVLAFALHDTGPWRALVSDQSNRDGASWGPVASCGTQSSYRREHVLAVD